MNNDPLMARLKRGIDALLSGSAPATGVDLTDIACYLDVEKNRHNPEIRKIMIEVVDKLHQAADMVTVEEQQR